MLINYSAYLREQFTDHMFTENTYAISKSLGFKAGVNAKASHILIGYEGSQTPNQKEKRTKEEAKAKAEEILAQVQANPDSFMMLAFTSF